MSRILGLLLFLPLLLGAAPIQRPQRIVSLNLCADQYLMALADPSQIAALTIYARDPQMSAAAAKAGGLPVSRGSAEDVLALRPDLIIASPGRRRETMEQLKGRHIATLDLPSAESYADVVAQIRLVANGIGYPERGEQLIAHMAQQLALPAYEQAIKASHLFNLLNARGVISVAERAAYIGRVRALAVGACEAWMAKHGWS